MVVVVSSEVVTAELNALLTLIGSSGSLQLFDDLNHFIGSFQLPNPAGTVFNNFLVFSGLPNVLTASSGSPVGATPTTFSVLNGSGDVLISGLPMVFGQSGGIIVSSASNPGEILGLVAGYVSSAVI